MESQQITISMPQIGTKQYKNNAKQIEDLVKELNFFTNHLQDKVSNMLKGQQTQFVNSYKDHMHKIQSCLKDYQNKIENNRKKIQYYENEGMLSSLLKNISFLESNQKKLLGSIQKKDKNILILKGQISTQQRQIAFLHQKIKYLLVNQQSFKNTINEAEKNGDPTFATQMQSISKNTVKSNNSNDNLRKPNQQYLTISPVSVNPQHSQQAPSQQLGRFRKQLSNLKKKNRQLSSVNSKILDKATSIEQFFLKTINDLKKKIVSRKKINSCTFQDFKQQDKLQLLIKVLSNEEILQHLYNKIFKKGLSFDLQTSISSQKVQKLALNEKTIDHLPAIASLRR